MEKEILEQRLSQLESEQKKLQNRLSSHQREILNLRSQVSFPQASSTKDSATQPPPIPVSHAPLSRSEALVTRLTNKTTEQAETENQPNIYNSPVNTSTHTADEHLPVAEISPQQPSTQKAAPNFKSLELQFGRVWLVRLGIISVLTGLIFLSNYAYHHYVTQWGATPRILGLLLISLLLTGLGSFFERKREHLANYGRVLASGGLAMFYYTAFASHHIERLKVIDSALLGGLVLTSAALCCLAYSLWKKSELTAAASIAFAFYATSINPIGSFALISSAILTAMGIYLFGKLKSSSIGFTTLIASYGSFIYWQFFISHSQAVSQAHWFLLAYWLLATIAVIFHYKAFKATALHTFIGLNNGLFFILFSIDYSTGSHIEPYWPFAAIYGFTLVAISICLKHFTAHTAGTRQTYLAQGLSLTTLALCLALSGPSLAMALVIQACLLSYLGLKQKRTLLQIASLLSLFLSFSFYLTQHANIGISQHAVLTCLYLAAAFIVARYAKFSEDSMTLLRALPSVLASACLASILLKLPLLSQQVAMCSLLLGVTINSLHLLPKKYNKLPEFAHLGHLFTLTGILFALKGQPTIAYSVGYTVVIAFMTLIQILLNLRNRSSYHVHILYVPLFTVALLSSLVISENLGLLLLTISAMPIAYHYLSDHLKLLTFKFVGLFLYLVSSFTMLALLLFDQDIFALIYLIAALLPSLHYTLLRTKHLSFMPCIAGYFLTLSVILLNTWVASLTPQWPVFTALLSILMIALEEKKKLGPITCIGLLLLAFTTIVSFSYPQLQINKYIIALSPIAGYFIIKSREHFTHKKALTISLACSGVISLWITATAHTQQLLGAGGISICWAVLGLISLSAGLALKDRSFRSMGFIILGFSVIHVYGVDVWKLTALLRICSFIILGVVLMIAGYLYCRRMEKRDE